MTSERSAAPRRAGASRSWYVTRFVVLCLIAVVTLFPIGLVLCLGVILSLVFGVLFGPEIWVAAVTAALGGNAALWLLLGPLMARWIRARTNRALDTLLANMVSVGESA